MSAGVLPFIPKLTEQERLLEDQAVEELMPYAKRLARKYHNPFRYWLDQEEILGDLTEEIVKAIDRYLHCVSWNDFVKIGHRMLYNRCCEILHKVFGTYRKVERTAYVLDEDLPHGAVEDRIFIASDFLTGLSDLAQSMVNCVIDPDEAMQKKIEEHVKYRNTLYKKGAGVKSIPMSLFAAVLGREIKEIKLAKKEIKRKLEDSEMNKDDTGVVMSTTNFAGKLQTAADLGKYYRQWLLVNLKDQCVYRGIDTEGLRRSIMVQKLQESDIVDGYRTEDEIGSDDSSAPIELEKPEQPDEEEEFDTKFLRPNGNGSSTKSKVEESDEISDFFDKDESPKKEAEKVVKKKEEKASSVDDGTHIVDDDVFQKVMNAMRTGESITITKLGPRDWSLHLSKNGDKVVDELPMNIASSNNVKHSLSDRKEEELVEEQEPDVLVSTEGKFKKGSKAWKEEVLSPDYVEFMVASKKKAVSELAEMADEHDIEWNKSDDEKVNRMRLLGSLRKGLNIDKYKPEYKTRKDRAPITLPKTQRRSKTKTA